MINEFIAKIPKAELLIHIEGSLEPALMLKLAKRNKIKLPYASIEEIQKAYHFQNLQAFLDLYNTGMQVLVTADDFYELTSAYLQKAASENVRHAEISFDAQAHLLRGVSMETMITGMNRAFAEAKKDWNISAGLILCFLRNLSEAAAQKILLQAVEFKDSITAVGLDSAEMNNPPEKFQAVFDLAREYGFYTVVSAGEEGPPEYIWQALDILKASRIGYAVRCVEDPDLMNRLTLTGTPLTICPVSNVKLHVVKSMQQHPLKKMIEQGLFVTISSDDPAYFGAYVNENFLAASAALKFRKADVYEMAKNSFVASFLESDRKQQLLNELEKFYAQANVPAVR
jgi:adenosine deaminase